MIKAVSQKELSANLIKLYLLALSVIAIFSGISQVLIQDFINEQQNDARVVNIAGRQRMLSQKLCKTAILLVNQGIFLQDAEHYSQDITDVIEVWERCHKGLKDGLVLIESTLPIKNSNKIDSMFNKLDPIFNILLTNANIIRNEVEKPSVDKLIRNSNALSLILKNERSYLKIMDKIVFQYDTEAKQRVGKLKEIELLLFALVMFVLILEGFFIFLPTYNQVNQTINKIVESETKLQKVNLELRTANASLNKAESELLKAMEDKYKHQIKDDKARTALLMEGQEEERKRIALELHDGIGQMLTGLKLISGKLDDNSFISDKDRKIFNDLQLLINDTISETRTISFNLMPSVLNDFGIISALRLLGEQTEKNSGLKVKLKHTNQENLLPKNLEITIYRIAQEAINNVMKHAQATELVINLFVSSNEANLIISDNGIGFDTRKAKSKTIKNGINNMRSRVGLTNGKFKISSINGQGTNILIKLPLGS